MAFPEDLAREMQQWTLPASTAEAARVLLATIIVYLLALAIARTGKKRFLGRNTVLDGILAIMLGSVLARAINGDADLPATAIGGTSLVGLHFLFGLASMHWSRLGTLLKGSGTPIVRDGEVLDDALHNHHLTRNDLAEAARSNGLDGIDDVADATFERSGDLSIVRKKTTRVVAIDVREGVQTVRVEFTG